MMNIIIVIINTIISHHLISSCVIIIRYFLESYFSCGGTGLSLVCGMLMRGFLFCIRDKSFATLSSSIIVQPLVLFNAIKNLLHQSPYAAAVLDAYF